jgi:Zn-dependent metalloprotease
MRISKLIFTTSLVTTACAVDATDVDAPASAPAAQSPHVTRALDNLAGRRTALGLDANHTFSVRKSHVDAGGDTHVRVQQLYRGIPVLGGTATLHVAADGSERELTDALVRGIAIDTAPALTAAAARAVTEAQLRPTPYLGDPRIALSILPEKSKSTLRAGLQPRTLRENSDDYERAITGFRLVYRVHTAEKHPYRERITFVDAHTGAIVKQLDGAEHFDYDAFADGHTFFNKDFGSIVRIHVDGPGDDDAVFQMEDPVRGLGQCWDEGLGGPPMTSNTGDYGDGKAFVAGVTSRKTAGVDAYFGRAVTWDMFNHVLNWRGLDGDGEGVDMGVHDPDQFNNALHSGWSGNLYFGDSDKPGGTMTPIDVVGHEYGHAVNSETAGLPGGEGQGGGMNEANGDIWGVLARIYFKKGAHGSESPTMPSTTMSESDAFWVLGADIGGLRSMFNPGIRYWSSSLDDTEEHKAAGPLDRMFFFLSQGSKSDVTSRTWSHSLPWGMTGLGSDKAARIWFRALTTYLQGGDEYPQARTRAISAVRDLFGQNGDEEKAVRNAFGGIDVGDPAVNAPAPPQVISSIEPNDSEAQAQVVSFPSTTPVPGLRKIDIVGMTPAGKDDFQITLPCGKSFGARLEVSGDYDLAIFQSGNSTALDNSTNGMFEDEVISLPSTAGCTGSTTFFVRVLFKSAPFPGFPSLYVLHMDRHD